ncbi:MAG TPA: type VI secretion system contractile sheath small subunit [Stellaceae bacterium]|jgi:type VI secretion system protein ImpB
MAESTQHVLSRVRPPRVQITYDVEIGGAIEKKQLPFIVGILADLSGQPSEPLPKVKDRKFVEIDRDNFDDVLAAAAPRLAIRVPNKLKPDANEMLNVELKFKSMDDFGPVAVVQQIEPLRKLFEARNRLRDLLTKLDGNDELDAILREVVASTEEQAKLRSELGGAQASGDGAVPAAAPSAPASDAPAPAAPS